MLQGSPPPSYAIAASNETSAPEYQEITERAQGFQYFQRTPRGFKIFDAFNANEPRYYMEEHHGKDRSSIVLHQGNGGNHSTLGRVTFSSASVDFVLAVDSPAASIVAAPDQKVVTCIGSHTHFGTHGYRFTIPGALDPGKDQTEAQSLIWKQTQNTKLRQAVWRPKDMTLVRETSNQVIAVYVHISETKNVAGRLEWRLPCSFDERTRALLVLAAFLGRRCKMHRHSLALHS